MNQKEYEIIMYYAEKPSKKRIMTEIMRHYGIFCIQWKQTHTKNIFSASVIWKRILRSCLNWQ